MLISLSLSKLFWVEVIIKFLDFYLCETISVDLKNLHLAKFAPCGRSIHHHHYHLHQQSIRNLLIYKTRTNTQCHFQWLFFSDVSGTTLSYVAPKLVVGQEMKPTKCSDVYALAISIYEILSDKESPWNGISDFSLRDKIGNGGRPNLDSLDDLYQNELHLVKETIKKVWEQNQYVRPTVTEVWIN